MPPTSLTIVLPAYNEEARLPSALDELFAYLQRPGTDAAAADEAARLPRQIDVLVVDDGSSDGTVSLVQARPEAARVDGIRLSVMSVPHRGKGAAVRAGMLAATGDLAIFADADMATPPDQLPKLVDALAKADVVLGSRIQPDGSDMRVDQPAYRRALGRLFHGLASLWVVGPVQDTQCGFKGFTRDCAQDVFARQRIESVVFDVEIIYLCRRLGYRLAIEPIKWFDKRGSRMRVRPSMAVRVAWDLFRIPLIHRRVKRAGPARTS